MASRRWLVARTLAQDQPTRTYDCPPAWSIPYRCVMGIVIQLHEHTLLTEARSTLWLESILATNRPRLLILPKPRPLTNPIPPSPLSLSPPSSVIQVSTIAKPSPAHAPAPHLVLSAARLAPHAADRPPSKLTHRSTLRRSLLDLRAPRRSSPTSPASPRALSTRASRALAPAARIGQSVSPVPGASAATPIQLPVASVPV